MPRRPKSNVAAEETLTLRLTSADRALLDRLVAKQRAELADTGADVTAASYVRALIRRDAKAQGVTAPDAAPPAAPSDMTAPPSPEATPPPATKGKRAARSAEMTPADVRAALLRAIEGGLSAREIARRAKVDPGSLSRFKAGRAGISEAKLRDIMRAIS